MDRATSKPIVLTCVKQSDAAAFQSEPSLVAKRRRTEAGVKTRLFYARSLLCR